MDKSLLKEFQGWFGKYRRENQNTWYGQMVLIKNDL